MTRQISVHTGKFLENFRKHGRAVPAPSRSPHRLARWAERRTRMTRMRDKKAFPPSRVACSCVWSTDAVRVCTRWCVRLVTGDRRVCVSVRVYTNGSDTHYICSLAALGQENFGKFSRAARAGKFSFKFSKTQVCPNLRVRCTRSPVVFIQFQIHYKYDSSRHTSLRSRRKTTLNRCVSRDSTHDHLCLAGESRFYSVQ